MRRRVATPDELERAVRQYGPGRAGRELRRRGLIPPIAGASGPTLIAHTAATGQGVTSSTINTTGTTLLVAGVSAYADTAGITDSAGNTWSSAPLYHVNGDAGIQIFYVISPTTSASHTFTTQSNGYPSLCVQAWGSFTGISLDVYNGATAAQPGSITPNHNGELVVTAMTSYSATASTASVDSGFTISDQEPGVEGVDVGAAFAYLVQTTATAIDPTWSDTGSIKASTIAAFTGTSSGGASGPNPRPVNWPQAVWRSAYR